MTRPAAKAGIWPTTVTIECKRHSGTFQAYIRCKRNGPSGLTPCITCPTCARDYYLNDETGE